MPLALLCDKKFQTVFNPNRHQLSDIFSYRTACIQHISNAYTTFNAPVSGVVCGVCLKVQAITRIHQATTSRYILLYTPDIIHIKLRTWICNANVIQQIIIHASIPANKIYQHKWWDEILFLLQEIFVI